MTTKESVEALLKRSPYNASSQPQLEAYVDMQAAGNAPYYMDANRSLLKLYQFSPQTSSEQKISTIMLLALLEYPSSDLLALSYLIPEKLSKTEPLASILHCSESLDSCKFDDFWRAFGGISESDERLKNLLSANDGVTRLQRSIVDVLALSYRTAPLQTVLSALRFSRGDEILQLNHPSVESVSAGSVSFVQTSDNTKRNRVFQEGVSFSAISTMMTRVTSE